MLSLKLSWRWRVSRMWRKLSLNFLRKAADHTHASSLFNRQLQNYSNNCGRGLGCPPVRGEFVIVLKCTILIYGNSDRCQACVRCMEGVRISEGPLWEVPLYMMHCCDIIITRAP